MSVKSVEDAVTGFFGHHIGDLNNIASVLGSLVTALPIDPQTKEHIGGVIGEIKTSADNIGNFLENTDVRGSNDTLDIKESDIVNALGDYFGTTAGKKVIADALTPLELTEEKPNA